MKKKWILIIMFFLILIPFLLNLLGIYPKEIEMLPGDSQHQEDYNGGEVTWRQQITML